MRFPLWLKLSFVLSLVFIAALWAVLNNTSKVFYQDKRDFLIEMSSKINSSNSKILQERIQNLQRKLAIFTSNYQSLSPQQKTHPDLDKVIFNQYPEFLAISLVTESASPIQWLRKQPSTVPAGWPDSEWASIFSGYSAKNVATGSVAFEFFQNLQKQQYILIIFPVELAEADLKNTKIVALLDASIFSDFLSEYKTTLNMVYVTDERGIVFAHPFANQIGASYANNTLVKDVVGNNRNKGAGDNYVDSSNEEIVASFEKVPGSNLYMYTTTPKSEAFRAADELWRSLLVIALGVILVGVVISFLFAKFITNPLDRLKSLAEKIGKGDFKIDIDVRSNDEVGDLASSIRRMTKDLVERDEALDNSKNALIQSEKMSAFGQLSAGIAHEVKNPLAGILGHAQLAKSKTQDNELLKHVNFIEKEARRTKEIVENLMKFARAEKLELVPTNLFDAVHSASDLVDHQVSLQGVKIFKHINKVSNVAGNSNQIQQVLLNLMMNASHAMENSEKKELHVYLDDVENNVRIRIQDTGSGMSKEVQERIFEPFFTTKPSGKGTGLGLSVSVGIVKDHKGKIYVESEVGKGTTFFIDIPKDSSAALPASTRHESEAKAEEISQKVEQVAKATDEEEIVLNREVQEEDSIPMPPMPSDDDLPEAPKTLAANTATTPVTKSYSMVGGRDYLMSDKEAKESRSKIKSVRKDSGIDDSKTKDFQVKIRKPKVK
jgi:signal transduction histidine kinase